MAGCIGVVAQLMDALYKFTLSVEQFLGYEKNGSSKQHLSYSLPNVFDTQDNLSEAMVSSLLSCSWASKNLSDVYQVFNILT